jgi:hypothetical protein
MKEWQQRNRDHQRKLARDWIQRNKDKAHEWLQKNKERVHNYKKKYKTNRPYYQRWVQQVLKSHKSRGYIINIAWQELMEYAKTITHCPLCGCKLRSEKTYGSKAELDSPSLDRINNEDIIDLEHCWIICLGCNIAKRERTLTEFLEYCKMVLTTQGYTIIPKELEGEQKYK